jgi:phosphoribosylformimino-5-aminoimidazole carboxamide ribotide isomerase
MSGIIVIPAIDIIDGKCVRLTQGDFNQKVIYNCDPVEVAKEFEAHGLKRLHLVDLDGARARKVVNHKVLEEISKKTTLTVDFSGGIATDHDVKVALNSGAKILCIGSIAYKDEPLFTEWLTTYGPERIILAADVKDRKLVVSGWLENTSIPIEDHVERYLVKGLLNCMATDIAQDGMLKGPSFELYKDLVKSFPSISWIAGGGVSCIEDIRKLDDIGVTSVIIGKAFYEKRITLEELTEFI